MSFKLVIGTKNYSSWSLRPWLVMKHLAVPFEEIMIPLYEKGTKEKLLRHSPSGKVPVLVHDGTTVWESLAICEYLADLFPEAKLWPEDLRERAHARSVSAEMHAGFATLRQHLPMSVRSRRPRDWFPAEVRDEIQRIIAIWRDCRDHHAEQGPFLFGHFTIADAMFAPVATRFRTYDVALEEHARAYVRAVLDMPAMKEWEEAATTEPHTIPKFE